jgi:transposase InsO family protein
MRDQFSISELCEALAVSRAGFHSWLKKRSAPPSPRRACNQALLEAMRKIHAHRHTSTYGSPRMTIQLRALGFSCSKSRVARIMRSHGIRPRPRGRFRPKTTLQDPSALPSPNLLALRPPPAKPGEQLVSDITYVPTEEGWLYLAVVVDRFSRAILGWHVSTSLHADMVTAAIQKALRHGVIRRGALFHSDRGCQYTASQTRRLLHTLGILQSMSAKGYCYDNAFAESVFATLKSDIFPDNHRFTSRAEALRQLFDYLETFYNKRRLHSSLGYQTPQTVLSLSFQNSLPPLN